MKVYILTHARSDDEHRDRAKYVGVYASVEKAEEAVQRLSSKPGFRNWPQGFEIGEDTLDVGHGEEGFISWDEAAPPPTE
jgi:homoserine kinase type II